MTQPHQEFNDDHTPVGYLIRDMHNPQLATVGFQHSHKPVFTLVVSANCKPKWILNAFKANATRTMREADCWHSESSPWVRRGSKREQQLLAAILMSYMIKVNLYHEYFSAG